MAITIKSEREIELMAEAGKILERVHNELEKALHPGMSTKDIDTLGEKKTALFVIISDTDATFNFIVKELLAKLAEYKPLAKIEEIEEQNYNMIDDRLNNGVEKFNREEEKKEQAENRRLVFP